MRHVKSGFLLLSTLALLVAGIGCPNSNPVDSGTGSATMAVSNVNPGKWGFATLSIYRVAFRAVDPEADDRQGTRDFLLTTEAIVVDTVNPEVDPGFFSPVYLAPGTYQIVELELADFYFDLLNYNFSTTECELLFVDNSDLTGNAVRMTDFPTPVTFTVAPNSDGLVQFTFDMAALGEVIEASYEPGFFPPPFCQGFVDVDMMIAELGTYLTID